MKRAALASLGLVSALASACGTTPPPARPALTANESWCPDGFEIGPQDTCFAVPESHTKDTPVVVYLHGMYKGHGSAEEWALVRSVAAKGFAVVIPRGKRGLCAWKAELSDHFCWPHEPEDPQSFKSIVAEWERVLWQIDALLEGGTHKRYVLGFSNGGFFAEHLATRGFFHAQAYAIVNGGPLEGETFPRAEKGAPPMLLLASEGEEAQGPKMKALHEGLAQGGWPHAYCARPAEPALSQADIDAAVGFFKKQGAGSLRSSGATVPCDAPLKPAP